MRSRRERCDEEGCEMDASTIDAMDLAEFEQMLADEWAVAPVLRRHCQWIDEREGVLQLALGFGEQSRALVGIEFRAGE